MHGELVVTRAIGVWYKHSTVRSPAILADTDGFAYVLSGSDRGRTPVE